MIKDDHALKDHTEHLKYRLQQYNRVKDMIEADAGSLGSFALGHKTLGLTFNQDGSEFVYREWCPAAQAMALIGDFNDWNPRDNHWLKRGPFGTWELHLPSSQAPKHGSRLKVRIQTPNGGWVDRIPAYATYATIPPNVMGAKYNGVLWNPPSDQRYNWINPRPPRPHSLRIYEAHVGMSSEEGKVSSYLEFKDQVLPRIKAGGYTAIQLMAIQEHAYYASFGYHVTNPFAVSSRSGTPEDLKALIDEAHRLGIVVLLDIVHSHISSNADDGLAGFDLGQKEEDSYFLSGEAGYHKLWDSRVLNYKSYECLRYLLSNLRFWIEEYQFDGFRFDGATSMLYNHHGINTGFSGNYKEYFGMATNVDACVYLMLANELVHSLLPSAVTVAEDVSGMPTLCRSVEGGGLGFDYRLAMAIPDKFIQLLKHTRDEKWSMRDLVSCLCNRRYNEGGTVGYSESHDQALVGDQTIAFRLMGAEMYTGMTALGSASAVIERGIAVHKMIRLLVMALGGEAYLNFMGNEFGHPEWIDFPREGNGWSCQYARRQWSLSDQDHLRYKHLGSWDAAMMALDDRYDFLSSRHQWVTHMDEERQVLVFERGPLVFVFNFSPDKDYEGLEVAATVPGKWRVALDSDAWDFGGHGRVGHDVDHFTEPASSEGGGLFHDRGQLMRVLSPARTTVVYCRVDEAAEEREREARERRRREEEEKERAGVVAEVERRRAQESETKLAVRVVEKG